MSMQSVLKGFKDVYAHYSQGEVEKKQVKDYLKSFTPDQRKIALKFLKGGEVIHGDELKVLSAKLSDKRIEKRETGFTKKIGRIYGNITGQRVSTGQLISQMKANAKKEAKIAKKAKPLKDKVNKYEG